MRRIEKLYVYASMKNDQDTREGKYQNFRLRLWVFILLFHKHLPSMSLNLWPLLKSNWRPLRQKSLLLFSTAINLKSFWRRDHVLSQEVEEVLARPARFSNHQLKPSQSWTMQVFYSLKLQTRMVIWYHSLTETTSTLWSLKPRRPPRSI